MNGLETIKQICENAREFTEIWNYEVFKIVAELPNTIERAQAKAMMKEYIRAFKGVSGAEFFKDLTSYVNQRIRENRAATSKSFKLDGMDREILTGEYMVDENGVYKFDDYGRQINVCNNPIYIEREIEPLDDAGNLYVELKYLFKGSTWKKIIIPKHVISDHREITALIEYGIDATTENAGALIQYLRTLQNWNVGARAIPTTPGCGRMGWVDKHNIFMPYAKGVEFTGAEEYREVFNAVATSGSMENWRKIIRPFYEPSANQIPRMALAASAAAPLLGYIDDLPFFVHLHGASGHGKTVSLMLAASIWGNPRGLVQSFNATMVGMERRAAMLCNMPVMLDEIGVYDSQNREVSKIIYQLTEGMGKVRGSLNGIRAMDKWSTVFLSTGEQPLTTLTSQAGIINRIISVNCNGLEIYQNPATLIEQLNQHYGHVGKLIVKKIMELGEDGVRERQKMMRTVLQCDIPDGMNKQILAASWLMVADQLLQEVVFGEILDGSTEWLIQNIKTAEEVSNVTRGMEFLEGWRTANGRHFFDSISEATQNSAEGGGLDVWGFKRDDYWAYSPQKVREVMQQNGMNYDAFVDEARTKGLIRLSEDGKRSTITMRLGKRIARFLLVKNNTEMSEMGYTPPKILDKVGARWRQSS